LATHEIYAIKKRVKCKVHYSKYNDGFKTVLSSMSAVSAPSSVASYKVLSFSFQFAVPTFQVSYGIVNSSDFLKDNGWSRSSLLQAGETSLKHLHGHVYIFTTKNARPFKSWKDERVFQTFRHT
jgi:hypothetical protein